MSSKLVKKLLRQANAFDEHEQHSESTTNNTSGERSKKKRGGSTAASRTRKQTASSTGERPDPAQQHVVALMLQVDDAVTRYSAKSGASGRVLKKRTKDEERKSKGRKRARASGGAGFSRSSSAPRPKHEATYDKKRAASDKKAKSLEDLARMLKKRKAKK